MSSTLQPPLIDQATAPRLWPRVLAAFPEANFLQSPRWGRVNELVGHKVFLLTDANINTITDADQTNRSTDHRADAEPDPSQRQNTSKAPHYWCQAIVKNAKRGRYLEIPGGPLLDWTSTATKDRLFTEIRAVATREHCVFVRLRPQLSNTDAARLAGLGLQRAPMHLHAEHTIILDLDQSEDALLAGMRRQTRYEVRRADKFGLTVDWTDTDEAFREFHRVQTATAARQHFVPPDLQMLLAEHTAFGSDARLYIARDPAGAPIAYGLILIDGPEAAYFEAASTELNQKLPGAYALQWQVIRDLRSLGVRRYNLWGIAPPDQPEHRYAKVTTFKKGFGGEIVEFVPAQDLVLQPTRYRLNLVIETIRKKRRNL